MTVDPTDGQAPALDEAQLRVEAWIRAQFEDPDRDAEVAAMLERAASSPSISPAELAEMLRLS